MEISFAEAVELATTHGGSLAWSAMGSLLAWGAMGLGAIALIYLACRRARLLELPDRRRWPHIAMVLVLLFAVWPAIAGAGLLTGLRDATTSSVRGELSRSGVPEAIGTVLVAPMVAIEAGIDPRAVEDDLDELFANDVSFLLDDGRRHELSKRVSAEMTRALLAASEGVSDSRVWRWLHDVGVERFVAELMQKARRYLALFTPLERDASGGLSFRSASHQVGQNLADRELLPRIEAPFNSARAGLLVSAAGLVLAPLLIVWLVRRC